MRFLVLGAGRMGYAVSFDLLKNNAVTQVTVVDADERALSKLRTSVKDPRLAAVQADLSDYEELSYLISGCDVVLSCATYKFNYELAKAAIEAGTHFCDLGGNEDIVRKQFLLDEMAREGGIAIVPDCGLAPGLVSILAAHACEQLDELSEIRLRVGALPLEPKSPLNYAMFSSVEGLINEYVEDVTAIRNGKLLRLPSLQDVEEIEFPAPFGKLEAFNTSGGISTLPATFGDRVEHLDYKSIRYPGHCQMVRMLRDLGLMDIRPLRLGHQQVRPRAILATLLERKLRKDEPDAVLVRVSVAGLKEGERTEIVWELVDYMDEATGLSATMRTTAFPISIIAQMLADGTIRSRGSLAQETSIPAEPFLNAMKARGIDLRMSERKLSKNLA